MALFARAAATKRVERLTWWRDGRLKRQVDPLAVEEPLEIRLCFGERSRHSTVTVTMRTPGADFYLAAGFLFTEGILHRADEVRGIAYCTDPAVDVAQQYNIVNVFVAPTFPYDGAQMQRRWYTNSSCGVCGKASIEALQACDLPSVQDDWQVDPHLLLALPERLNAAQSLFRRTGGVHAAGLFDSAGNLLCAAEDVGRHNAVDKVIGQCFLEGSLPASETILQVSGRLSFELVQKAAMAGIPILSAISAPSSLAVDTAQALQITLVAFDRGDHFNVYTHPQRLGWTAQEVAAQSANG